MFQATNCRDCTWEDLNMVTKRKPQKRNWISSNNSSKLRHKDRLYESEIRKCWLGRDRGKKSNQIISGWSKQAQKEYKTRYDWVGVIYWESSRRLNFDPASKWYIHRPESVLKNETQKILCDVLIKTVHLNRAEKPDIGIINKKRNK